MTRAAQLPDAVVPKRKPRPTRGSLSKPAPMTFLVSEDNAGAYHWTIVVAGGETLAQSASFASYEEAERAACIVRGSASQASFEPRSGDTPPAGLPARRGGARTRDPLDAERWLDEGGSFRGQAVTR